MVGIETRRHKVKEIARKTKYEFGVQHELKLDVES